jgi:proline racemase
MEEGEQSLVLESPAGLAHVKATNRNGRCESITTQGEPAYVAARDQTVEVPHYGKVRYDLVWSGAYFALVDAAAYGFTLQAEEVSALTAFGAALVTAARPQVTEEHPELGRVGPLPFAHFMGPLEAVEPKAIAHARQRMFIPG